jgi:hypothetical protein
MSKNYTLTGIGSSFEIGPGGPRFVNSGGVIQATLNDGTTFQNVRGLNAVDPNDFVTLQQLQNFSAGLSWKNPAFVATDANIDILSAPATIDGVSLLGNERVLVKDQSDASENGIYIFIAENQPLVRAADLPLGSNATNVALFVSTGPQGDTAWVQVNDPATVGPDDLQFIEFASIVPGIQDIVNVGNGAEILQGIVSGTASLRTLTSTDNSVTINIPLAPNDTTIDLSVPAAAPAINFRSLTILSSDYSSVSTTTINIGAILPVGALVLDASVYVNRSFDGGPTLQIDAGANPVLLSSDINLSIDSETFIGTNQVPASGTQLTAALSQSTTSFGVATIVVRFAVIS